MKLFALISVGLGLGVALFFEGNFLHVLFLTVFGIYVIGPVSLVLAFAALYRPWRPWCFKCFQVTALLTLGVLVSGLAGQGLHEWRVHQIHVYVSRAVAFLDAQHAQTGKYPTALPTDVIGSPPKWLSPCSIGPQEFRFEYWDPAGMMDGYEFNSTTRTWRYFD